MKSAIRKQVKEFYESLSDEDRAEKNQLISKSFLKILIHWSPGVWGVFRPMSDEPDWTIFLDEGFGHKFYPCEWEETEESGCLMGFFNPDTGEEIGPDYLLVPGLGFTRAGDRLGRGKGFYDRYLETFEGRSVGICFEEQVFAELPTEEHDQQVDFVLTEKELIECD